MANKIQKLKNSTNDTIYPVTVKDAIYDNLGNPLSIADTASVVAVGAKVGDLSLLTTTNKTSAVNAINEVDSDVTSLVNTVNGINSNINAVDNKIGLLSALQTIDKTDVVSAINENSSAIGQLQTNKQDGITTIKDINCHSLVINKEYIVDNTNKSASGNSNLNYPNVSGLFHLKVENTLIKDSTNGVYYTAKSRDYGTIYTKFEVNGVYSPWIEVATTEKYVMQASDMRNGWILVHGKVLQKIGNRVFARFTISSGATAVHNVACNVPVGFRPSAETFITVKGNFDTSENPVNQFMTVYPDGNIQIRYKDSKPNIFIETSWEV